MAHILFIIVAVFLLPCTLYAEDYVMDYDTSDCVLQRDGTTPNSSNRCSGDFDGDGIDDIAIVNSFPYSNKAFIIKGGILPSSATLSSLTYYYSIDSPGSCSVFSGDINGDSIDDMICQVTYSYMMVLSTSTIYVIYGGDPGPKSYNLGSEYDIRIIGPETLDFCKIQSIEDYTGDGIDDISLVVWNRTDPTKLNCVYRGIFIISGSRTLTGQHLIQLGSPYPGIDIFTITGETQALLLDGVRCTDIDNDSIPDIVLGHGIANGLSNSKLLILLGKNKTGTEWDLASKNADITIQSVEHGCGYPHVIKRTILSDGSLLFSYRGNYIDISNTALLRGAPIIDLDSYTEYQCMMLPGTSTYYVLQLGRDFDGDEIDDIIITASNESLPDGSLENVGAVFTILSRDYPAGSWPPSRIDTFPQRFYGGYTNAALSYGSMGDFNNDGYDDLSCYSNSVNPIGGGIYYGNIYIIYGFQALHEPTITIVRNQYDTFANTVDLLLSVRGEPIEMILSGDFVEPIKDNWIPFSPTYQVTLTAQTGTKRITVRYRNDIGRMSDVAEDTTQVSFAATGITTHCNLIKPPAHTEATFSYYLAEPAHVKARVHTLTGELVRVLIDEDRPSELSAIPWDGTNDEGKKVADGVYVVTIAAGNERMRQKIIVEQ